MKTMLQKTLVLQAKKKKDPANPIYTNILNATLLAKVWGNTRYTEETAHQHIQTGIDP